MAILGVDVGGTFTDAVLLDGGRVRTAKVPTAARQEESVLAAARGRRRATDVERFAHGTTVATNALLERRGARTAFVGNAGFEHLLHLRRQTRAHLYRLCAPHPEPLVPLERCHGVRGRLGPDGELEPLDLASLPDLGDAEAVAVCLLFSFRDPRHEAAVAAELRRRHPGVHVVASHEVAPEFREYERASTTAADAYLAPVAARYLRALAARPREAGLAGAARDAAPRAASPRSRRRRRIRRRSSSRGRPAGVVGAGLVARRAGFERRDRVRHGRHLDRRLPAPRRARRRASPSASSAACRSGCRPSTCTPSAPAAARSSGVDAGGALRVGPESAGAHPGPGLLRRGRRADGHRREPPARPAAGRAARAGSCSTATRRRARSTGSTRPAVVDVVNAEMLRALRVVSVERGHDPRDFALVAFGGAGPLHACALAEELGIEAVLVPEAAGVLSALGLVASDERRDRVVSHVRPLAEVRRAAGRGRGRPPLPRPVVRADGAARSRTSRRRSTARTRSATATRIASREIELVAVRTAEVVPGPDVSLPADAPPQGRGARRSSSSPGATCWVPDGWRGETDGDGTLVLTR